MTRSTQGSRRQAFYATSPYWTTSMLDGQFQRVPTAQVHAKTVGTTQTLCGQSTLSWSTYWHIGFATVRHDRCPRCTDVLLARG